MARDAQIQVRRDTAANWTSVNPVLAAGEFGLETDTGFTKLGDGSSTWTALRYNVRQPKVEVFTPIGAKDIIYKYLNNNVATLTTLTPHGFQVGDNCVVHILDSVFDSAYASLTGYTVASATTYSFSYNKVATNTASTLVNPMGQATKPQYWTKDPNAKIIEMRMVGAGAGGGSGRRGNITSNRGGGAGGPAGNYHEMRFLASDIPAGTFTGSALYVGVRFGGAGGLSVTTDDTNGNAGAVGQAGFYGGFTFGLGTTADGVIWGQYARNGTVSANAGGTGGSTADVTALNNVSSYSVFPGGAGGSGYISGGQSPLTGSPQAVSGGGGGAGATAASATINFINVTSASVASVVFVAVHNISNSGQFGTIKIENSASSTYNGNWVITGVPTTTSLTINNFTGGTGSATGGVSTFIKSAGGPAGTSGFIRTLNPVAANFSLGGFYGNNTSINAASSWAGTAYTVMAGIPGTGGGGGGYATGSAGGIGGNAFNYGAGGGGGGASDNGFPSGSGGYGGDACIVITSYY